MTTVLVEVTNTLEVPFLTGLQRVTRELMARLPSSGDLVVEPVRWCEVIRSHRRLTPGERRRLAGGVRRLPRSRIVRGGARRAERVLQRRRRSELEGLRVGSPWPADALWFDLEATWHSPVPRHELLPRLMAAGIPTAALVADVFPETHPEWFDPTAKAKFSAHLDAHLVAGSHLVCISESTRREVLAIAAERGRAPSADVVVLGADFHGGSAGRLPEGLAGTRVLLSVSTLEPRKNQVLLLDVFDRIRADHPDVALVLVGKQGWHVDELVAQIRSHPEHGRRLHWIAGADDATLVALYRHATVSLVPSFAEGFGFPVVESLAEGVPVISSTGGALPEVGGDVVEYAAPDEPEAWERLVRRHLENPDHHAAVRARLAGYRPPTWEQSAAQVTASLRRLASA